MKTLTFILLYYLFAVIPSSNGQVNYQPLTSNSSVLLDNRTCHLNAIDTLMYNRIRDMVSLKVKLINYNLTFPNSTINPLEINNTWSYNPNKWARVSKQHGQTLLSLAFNYGLLSLMTLTFGTEKLHVELEDVPAGCLSKQQEKEKVEAVMYLLMRDFRDIDLSKSESEQVVLVEDERVCHEVIKTNGYMASFTDRCCMVDRVSKKLQCEDGIINIWLSILFNMLFIVKIMMLFFGPVLFIPAVEKLSKETIPYIVKLKTPLVKTIYLCRSESPTFAYNRVLDLRHVKRFPKFKESIENIPVGEPVKVKITEYHILVNYTKLLVENAVPVGVINSIIRNVFQCKIKEIEPFKKCCHTNMLRNLKTQKKFLWISFWKGIARILVVLSVPIPFYIRLILYYIFEYKEVTGRNAMLESLGLKRAYDGNMMQFLGPTHPLFIAIYCIYISTVIIMGLLPKRGKARFRRILVGVFRDLKNLDWVAVLQMLMTNIIWPFRRFGAFGCLIAIIYWTIAVPIFVLIAACYFLPVIYLTMRMLFYTSNPGAVFGNVKKKITKGDYRVDKRVDESIGVFSTETIVQKIKGEYEGPDEATIKYRQKASMKMQIQRFWFHIFAAVLMLALMYASLFILAECMGFLLEIAVFTLMGIIVNAGTVLKFTILLIMTAMYSYDCYNNVGKKYLKLNKALFGEVKGRIKDLWDITSMPSYLQENRGFKSEELDEQADYECPDDVAEKPPLNLYINDLILFVDSEDMPRIPKDLFYDVCQIQVAGAPGPVYRSLIAATKEFLTIVCFLLFVFIIVMSFGTVYKVSTTNQMLATIAGGFLPFLMKTFLVPSKPDIEIGTVSFKSKLDEIIQNFFQFWPIYDFPLKLWTEDDEKAAADKDSEETEKHEAVEVGTQTDLFNKTAQDNIINHNMINNNIKSPKKEDLNAEEYCNEKKSDDKDKTVIDILIHLPLQKQQGWLEEWSDIEQYGQEPDIEQPVDAEELEAMEKEAEEDEDEEIV